MTSVQPVPGTLAPSVVGVQRYDDGDSMKELLALAIREKTPADALERLVALKERLDATAAAKAFHAAMAEFRKRCPQIKKEQAVDYVPSSGGARVKYNYAPLDDIAHVIDPLCQELGLSYSWNSATEGANVKVECVARHVGGHAESSFFACPTTTRAGMSDQQKFGAAVKYAMRWALILRFGLVTTDDADDAAEVDPTPITAEQVVQLEDMIEAAKGRAKKGDNVLPRFLKFMGVEKLSEVRASEMVRAVEALRPKKAEQAKEAAE